MRVWALSDPHLSFGTPGKAMDVFGPEWVDHAGQMARAWDESVEADDLVLVPGDISWARKLDGALPDLEWLAARPGTKTIIKGNHEMWWTSRAKVRAAAPEGIVALEADAARVGDVALAGTRMWDVPGVSWHDAIAWKGEAISAEMTDADAERSLKVYRREVGRLERALAAMDRAAPLRVAMVHYPPVGPELAGNELTAMFEAAGVHHVVYGHLHSLKDGVAGGGELNGVRYHLTSCDFVGFAPVMIAEA